jgi:splicing factor U2AF 65 kDa subunit
MKQDEISKSRLLLKRIPYMENIVPKKAVLDDAENDKKAVVDRKRNEIDRPHRRSRSRSRSMDRHHRDRRLDSDRHSRFERNYHRTSRSRSPKREAEVKSTVIPSKAPLSMSDMLTKIMSSSSSNNSISNAHSSVLANLSVSSSLQNSSFSSASSTLSSANKAAKEVYVGNLPLGIGLTPKQIQDFFNIVLNKSNLLAKTNEKFPSGYGPVVSVRMAGDSSYAFAEMRLPEEVDLVLTLNGIRFLDCPLKLGRPKGYADSSMAPGVGVGTGSLLSNVDLTNILGSAHARLVSPPAAPSLESVVEGSLFGSVVRVTPLPSSISTADLKQITSPFGVILRCLVAGHLERIGFVQFKDPQMAKLAVSSLLGLRVGDVTLAFSLANEQECVDLSQVPVENDNGENVLSTSNVVEKTLQTTGTTLQLLNLCIAKDLVDPEEVLEIKEDIVEEASKFGRVMQVVIPPPIPGSSPESVVPVYLRADSVDSAEKIVAGLSGRRFQGRTVSATLISEGLFLEKVNESDSSSSFASNAIAPPNEYPKVDQGEIYKVSELPEDNLILPNVPAVADID